MYDYMRSLQKQFTLPMERAELEKDIDQLTEELRKHLDKPERKILLRLLDAEDRLRDKAALNSFFSGYRLASGIYKELSSRPPHNFNAEEERRAREFTEQVDRYINCTGEIEEKPIHENGS